ncbi:hypothetical protein CVT24_006675, partial [Panaeolus cyanescens]
MSDEEKGYHILRVTQDDPLGRWGYRLIREKLAAEGIHISRDEIMKFRSHENPTATAARHPVTRKVHPHGIYSAGPNEEWCIDGHEKILNAMGIAIYGIIDKYSRMELGLWAVPNARLADVPPMLYLQLVKKLGGMPPTTTSDMGSEVSKLIPLVTTLRNLCQPYLSEDEVQSFRTVKSVYNITRERGWGPIWQKHLSNILLFYKAGELHIGYQGENSIHKDTALWIWSQVVQKTLDRILKESQTHRSQKWGGNDKLLIKVSEDKLDQFNIYNIPEVLQFGSPQSVERCNRRYVEIGSPEIKPQNAWVVFASMLDLAVPPNWSSNGI